MILSLFGRLLSVLQRETQIAGRPDRLSCYVERSNLLLGLDFDAASSGQQEALNEPASGDALVYSPVHIACRHPGIATSAVSGRPETNGRTPARRAPPLPCQRARQHGYAFGRPAPHGPRRGKQMRMPATVPGSSPGASVSLRAIRSHRKRRRQMTDRPPGCPFVFAAPIEDNFAS
jgi:hypothetical protein